MRLKRRTKDSSPKWAWNTMLAMGMVGLVLISYIGASGNEKTVRVTTEENGSSVSLRAGDLLEVMLPASLGTGFSWRVRNGAESVLRSKGKPETKKPEGKEPEVGATEYQIFRFEAKAAGTGRLELEYSRPWEKDVAPAKTYSLAIHVE
jgi:inhibitor of cysteine peptidase